MVKYVILLSFLLSFILPNKHAIKSHINSSKYDITLKTTRKKRKHIDQDKTIVFLCRENRYNKDYKITFSEICLNDSYCKTLSDPERAIIGYIATFIGSDCNWDGEYKTDRSNLKCKILTALKLGYQCSDTHLGFLRKWFKGDKKVLQRLEDCSTTPYTATIQNTFEKIQITQKKKDFFVTINASGINSREDRSWYWKEVYHFNLNHNNRIKLISQKSFKIKDDKL